MPVCSASGADCDSNSCALNWNGRSGESASCKALNICDCRAGFIRYALTQPSGAVRPSNASARGDDERMITGNCAPYRSRCAAIDAAKSSPSIPGIDMSVITIANGLPAACASSIISSARNASPADAVAKPQAAHCAARMRRLGG